MTTLVKEAIKVPSDIATGSIIAQVNDQPDQSLVLSAITIIARLLIEWVVNRKLKKGK